MASVRGPLFSIGASGTVARLLTFNPGKQSTTVRKKPNHAQAPTFPQASTRQKCRNAAAAWHALDPVDREEWSLLAKNGGRLPFAKYLLEWMAQASTPDQPPLIPMK